MLLFSEMKENPEISKLISFGLDLHLDEMNTLYFGRVPNFEFSYNDSRCWMKETDKGGIFGYRGYPNHSSSEVCTIFGVVVGKREKNEFNLDFAIRFDASNEDSKVYIAPLCLDKSKNGWETL